VRNLALLLALLTTTANAATDRFFETSDHTRLHYLEAGKGRTILLVPGWTMPAWIFQPQIDDLAKSYRVIAFDPRGQGDSAIPTTGYEPHRRGADIAELIAHLKSDPPVVVAWSLGVLDTLAAIHDRGDADISGLVLVDNSVGEDPPPTAAPPSKGPRLSREVAMQRFVAGMFARKPPQPYLDRLTEAALRTPEPAARALLSYPVPRTFWKEAVYSTAKPTLYIVRPKFAGQAHNLAAHHPAVEIRIVENLGHALFVDDPAAFNRMVRDFIARRIWAK
jgi:microsomal epoxide hydrolase